MREMERFQDEKILKECTFKPAINSPERKSWAKEPKSFNQSQIAPVCEKYAITSEKSFLRFDLSRSNSPGKPDGLNRYLSPPGHATTVNLCSSSRGSVRGKLDETLVSPRRTNKIYHEIVQREWQQVIDAISSEKKRIGLIFDDFVTMMLRHGYAKIENVDLLNSVFHMATGFVKDIHAGKQQKF